MPLKSPPPPKSGPASPRQPVFYAIVQHDFMAERADELEARAGDHISVVAQSNYEWFVAKPISRLGRPGLIPVSFVAIHDPGTGRGMSEGEVQDLMLRGDIPGVEEWKKSILEYKAASISLGVLDDDGRGSVPNSPYVQTQQQIPSPLEEPPNQRAQTNQLPPGIPVQCEVVSWHQEASEYWFRLNALYQPDSPDGFDTLPPARQLILYRIYQDFHDLQVTLKLAFPVEAGDKPARPGEKPTRILPFMPSPVKIVTEDVTVTRKDELNGYVGRLCKLWNFGADHMLRHRAVRNFFSPRSGDNEEETESATWILNSRSERATPIQEEDEVEQISQPFNGLSVHDPDNRLSDGSRYEDDGAAGNRGSDGRTVGSGYGRNIKSPPPTHDGERIDSVNPRSDSPFTSSATARTQSPFPTNRASSSSSRNYSAEAAMARSTSTRSRNDNEQVITYNGQRRQSDESPRSFSSNPSQLPSSNSLNGGRARSMSNANSPAISATNPNPAFVKIKIFDRLTQDLIAIRVNPRVTHAQLMDKVRARLGDDVHQLAFRNSISNTFLGLGDDAALKNWLENTDKHVLYAD